MMKPIPALLLVTGFCCVPADAGMTVITLTELARLRLESLSFFIVAFLLVAWGVKGLWNHLAKVVTAMPRLGYTRALALVFLSGLLFFVVLTMISGARELLTPGAWEKQGFGYRLRAGAEVELTKEQRREAMGRLREIIWQYAADHGGQSPPSPFAKGLEADDWKFPGGGYYALITAVDPGSGREILIYEPAAAGARRVVLLADGSIEDLTEGDVKRRVEDEQRRRR